MEYISHMDVKSIWGNSNYKFVASGLAGNSGSILCVWEDSIFKKDDVSISDNFIALYRTWLPTNSKVLIVDYGENKSPRPDGYTFEFFRRFWNLIGLDFCLTVLCFSDHGFFPRGCNSSFIALIPKVTDTKFVTDFWPTSLIGSVYKVLTKILANRLAMAIFDLVSNTQSTFVAGRQILDGPFILNEVLAWCKRKKKQAIIFKVDFANAYDSVRWDFLLDIIRTRLSKWKVKTIFVGGKLTLLKLVLGAVPIYNMSIYKTPKGVLHEMEMLLFRKVGNGVNTRFWLDTWILDMPLRVRFPRIYALDSIKDVSVVAKFGDPSLDDSFRRQVRDGSERQQWLDLVSMLDAVLLSSSSDRWYCEFNGDGAFRVKEVRSNLDDLFLPSLDVVTRWVRYVPIKINVFTWRARLDRLHTKGNLINRGVSLDSPLCPICGLMLKDSQHLFFRCDMVKCIFQMIFRWWNLQWVDAKSFDDWFSWFKSVRMPGKPKDLLEGVFYTSWWHIWNFQNRLIFDASPPRRSVIFDDIVLSSFNWCVNRCNS
nr:RNA-directed DNA polymerase, eukaryota [Tanacetum cinerariifolium]